MLCDCLRSMHAQVSQYVHGSNQNTVCTIDLDQTTTVKRCSIVISSAGWKLLDITHLSTVGALLKLLYCIHFAYKWAHSSVSLLLFSLAINASVMPSVISLKVHSCENHHGDVWLIKVFDRTYSNKRSVQAAGLVLCVIVACFIVGMFGCDEVIFVGVIIKILCYS